MNSARYFLLLNRLVIVLGLFTISVGVNVALAKTIYTATHFFGFNGDPIAVQIDVEVLDNFLGDNTKYLWRYTVTNNSYDPEPGISNGFSGFETALPTSITLPDIGNISSPSPSWIIDCCSGEPVEWDIPNSNGFGVMPGQHGVFEFTSRPRTPISSDGWFHTWTSNYQNYIVYYTSGTGSGNGPEVPSVLGTSFVDPVPDLLSTIFAARQGSIDPSALTSKGKVVKGVSADGVAEILVRIGADHTGENFTLTIDSPSNENGSLGTLSDDVPSSNTISVTAIDTPLGPMAFALYKAPQDFARADGSDDAAADRTVNINAHPDAGSDFILPVNVVRPPVVLIHGIWSNPTTWDFFNVSSTQSFANPQDPRFHIYRANYRRTNADGFAINAPIVLGQIENYIAQFKKNAQVAAVRADIVAHSMGGDITRTFVIEPDFLNDQNYNQGDVHKLITIDTPHLGSRFANNLLASNIVCKTILSLKNMKVAGAVQDLAEGSVALQNLQTTITPLPTHAIVGVATDAQTSTAEQNAKSSGLLAICRSLLPNDSFVELLGAQSDLIVPANSQLATGLGYNGSSIPQSIFNGIVHVSESNIFTLGPDALSRGIDPNTKATVFNPTPIPGEVINLLNASVLGSSFGPIKP